MPIIQPDSWRKQFFNSVICPENVIIPTKDTDAYCLNPQHNWVYNKLVVANKQDIKAGPHGTTITNYPVFSKPIYNLRSMGAGIEVFNNAEEYYQSLKPGYMWSTLLTGEHFSSDVAVIDGKVEWICHTKGFPLESGTFDYWALQNNKQLHDIIGDFVANHLSTYTGMLNFETIGNKIIEIHLRFADQWPDIYGTWFINSLVNLYANKTFPVGNYIEEGYSVVLFASPNSYKKPKAEEIEALLKIEYISSIQLPFHESAIPESHSMPPGGMRIAIVNGFNLEACQYVRERLKVLLNAA